ncbi:unnamed protein product [Bursaphelenchus okinawaensis]|uniref:Sorting nexin n=1 Tax=Bursaphelenchus okinawaensis TaxID=465554 RepID=A0A811KUG4_9BILA|nr:unnamed protein product [Bursaphelenchus okinawaensis]CAG9112502.1 unnamed protein product [Bursaphelenchus okinawaensis]
MTNQGLLKSPFKIPQKLPYLSVFHPMSRRFHFLLLIMLGYFVMVYQRTNLGVAVTCMVNSSVVTSVSHKEDHAILLSDDNKDCQAVYIDGGSVERDYGGDLDWDASTQAWLFSASFYGSIVSLIPAGVMADRYSPKRLLMWSALISTICSLVLPYLARENFELTFISRFLMGIAEGFILPSINKMVSQWIPADEMSTAASVYTTGSQMAGFFGAPLAAVLCTSSYKWPSIFYVSGVMGIVWILLWMFTVTDTPTTCKVMTTAERQYLNRKLASDRSTIDDDSPLKVPYWAIATSLPLWSLLLCTFTANMLVVLTQAYLPLFFKQVLYLGMIQNGFFSAAPNVSMLIVKFLWSIVMDKLKQKRLSSTAACKISQGFSSVSVGIIFITLAAVADCRTPFISLTLFCAMTMCFSTAISGFYTSLLSLAPLYTGTLTSISMVAGNLGRLITPLTISYFNKTGSMQEWRMVFYFMALSTLFSGALFLLFGSGSPQQWGIYQPERSLTIEIFVQQQISQISVAPSTISSLFVRHLPKFGVMATNQVKACYDFDAQPGSGELTIKEGEMLMVIRDNIDGGWMEGKNAKGKVGLFPESYVTRVTATSSLPPQAPPPVLPTQDYGSYSQPPVTAPPTIKPLLPSVIGASTAYDPWADEAPAQPLPLAATNSVTSSTYPILPQVPSGNHMEDDFDDEWTEDDEENAEGRSGSAHEHRTLGTDVPASTNGRSRTTSGSRTDLSAVEDDVISQSGNEKDKLTESLSTKSGNEKEEKKEPGQQRAVARSRSAGPDTVSLSSRQGGAGGAARMKNINRFSNFVKTGMEAFILNTSKMNQQPTENFEVVVSDGHVRWAPSHQQYQCTVDKPKKESKLKGLKSFIAYSMTSSLTGIQVSRRYKHFDWLHEQLTSKFLLIPSPPLPEKQVAGRYEEDLIEHRKVILQLWVNKICRHPVLGQAEVWMHFMNCTDEKKWKAGKRQAEKDEYVGGNFFHCVRVPDKPLEINKVENQVETFARCCRSLEDSVKVLYERINESQKRLTGPYKSNWQKSAAAFEALGQSFELDQTCGTQVTSAIRESASVMHKIGVQHEEHGKRDMEQLLDWLYTYKGLLANIPDMLNVHKSALAKLKDNERLQAENKLSPQDSEAIRQRVDVVSYSLLAEITQLNEERNDDFREMLGGFFEHQANFYSTMGQQFSELSRKFKSAHN